jgi:hypothetical protein
LLALKEYLVCFFAALATLQVEIMDTIARLRSSLWVLLRSKLLEILGEHDVCPAEGLGDVGVISGLL